MAQPNENDDKSSQAQDPSQNPAQNQGGAAQRSENLLPADDGAGGEDDGRYNVAEEVSLDQQSDASRRVGQPPKGIASDALADSLKGDGNEGGG